MTSERIPHPRTIPDRDALADPGPGPGPYPGSNPERRRRRWPRFLAAVLLITGPAGYYVIAAEQSHSPAAARELRTEMAGMVQDWPSDVQEHVYQVPVPSGATGVEYFEHNSWKTSSLFARFQTSAGGLDTFLAQLGISRAALEQGHVTIDRQRAQRVGWTFAPTHDWDGVSLPGRRASVPGHDITVDMDDPDAPVVYVVSTVTFSANPL